tara:strand:+ start:490 stop:1278 length:789 start_codon:yes stop_codon:yes gene_type:complete
MASGSQSLGTGYNNASVQGLSLISGATGGSPQGIYEESSTQEYPIGQLREFEDGRCFRYASFAAATAAGLLVSTDKSATCVVEIDNKATAAAIGATEVILTDSGTLGSATKNQYAGALLHVTDDAGEGYQYKIKSNTAASSNAVTFTLYDGLVIALTTASDVAITGSMYNTVRAATAGTDPIVAGVTARVMQSGYYGWIQTAGIATILSDVALAFGNILTLSDGVAGAVQLKDAETEPLVGTATFTPDDTGHVGVLLQGIAR